MDYLIQIPCSGETHEVVITNDLDLILLNHPNVEEEIILKELSGRSNVCIDILDKATKWGTPDAVSFVVWLQGERLLPMFSAKVLEFIKPQWDRIVNKDFVFFTAINNAIQETKDTYLKLSTFEEGKDINRREHLSSLLYGHYTYVSREKDEWVKVIPSKYKGQFHKFMLSMELLYKILSYLVECQWHHLVGEFKNFEFEVRQTDPDRPEYGYSMDTEGRKAMYRYILPAYIYAYEQVME